jgi:hypothetical protein
MTIHQRLINIFSKKKKYFVILQGPRGSGKTQFTNELQAILSNNITDKNIEENIEENPDKLMENLNDINCKFFVICSIDDYYNENNYSFGKNLSLSYSYCKNKAKKFMKDGYSIIYNNTNLDEKQYTDIINECISLGYCPIILRFFTAYDEKVCVQVSRDYHPITQQTCSKQTIIRDNIVMFHFKNEFEILMPDGKKNKKILPIFGVKSNISQKRDNQYIFEFNITNPNIDELKNSYISKGWFIDIPPAPKLKPLIQTKEVPEFNLGAPAFNNTDDIPPSIKYEMIMKDQKIQSLEDKIAELENQLKDLSVGTIKGENRRRQRF